MGPFPAATRRAASIGAVAARPAVTTFVAGATLGVARRSLLSTSILRRARPLMLARLLAAALGIAVPMVLARVLTPADFFFTAAARSISRGKSSAHSCGGM